MGYAPPGNSTQSSSLAHYSGVTYWDKVGLDRLEQMFRFGSLCDPHPLPLNSGKVYQTYRFTLPGANTVPSAETVGTPFSQTSTTVSATVEQFSDFTSSSEFLMLTDIAQTTTRMADDMSYRAAKTADTVFRTEFDANTGQVFNMLGTAFSAADLRKNKHLLTGIDVRGREDMGGDFGVAIHPYVSHDVIADNTAGGFIDVMKYADPSRMISGEIGKVAGCRLLETTNVNTSGSAPQVLYYTYIVGQGAVGNIDLMGRGPTKVVDARNERFRLNVVPGGPSPADPEGNIGQYVSYWFATAAKTLDSTNFRYRIVQADSSII